MAGAAPFRAPRAFPNGVVSVFNSEVSSAQALLIGSPKLQRERIRLVFMLANADMLCLTDRYALVLLPTGRHVVQRIALRRVDGADVDAVFVGVRWKGRRAQWKFASATAARQACYFVETQRVFLAVFGASLLP
jgi:hypothetical protein